MEENKKTNKQTNKQTKNLNPLSDIGLQIMHKIKKKKKTWPDRGPI